MIKNVVVRGAEGPIREGAVIIPLFEGARRLGSAAARVDRALGNAASRYLSRAHFRGERGETRLVAIRRRAGFAHLVLLGLGQAKNANAEEIAHAAGAAARALASQDLDSAAVVLDDIAGRTPEDAAHAFVKGFGLGRYRYSVTRRGRKAFARLTVVSERPSRALASAIRRARLVVELVERVRDLVNAPANALTPAVLAEEARALCRASGVRCLVWGRREIGRRRMGAVLGVAMGSREEPKFIVMEHGRARRDLPLVCLVGKGVTFDSGGISIKSWERMNEMKGDMAGGAVVMATIAAAARLSLPVRLVGLVPCVENMPDGGALRPGDVVTTCSGKTIEVVTTDAEGRLILSDAISYACSHYRPDVVVDVATLTGGVLVALGTRIAGLVGNSSSHLEALATAGERAGEPVWALPLDDHFYRSIKGDHTDYKNYSGRNASPITGAALIGAFAGDTPWAHIDIAGTAWNDGEGPSYQTKGATGYGVDLLLRFLEIVGASRD